MDVDEGPIEVQAYDPLWVDVYQAEAAAINEELGTYVLAVEHFGSTAVPGLVAKPIVDVLIGAAPEATPAAAINGLARLGYEFLGEDGRRPGRYFWRKRGNDAINVSVVPHGGAMWNSNLAVRDFLRAHPDWADRYAEIKRRALDAAGTSMLGYQNHKRTFVDGLRQTAVCWAAIQQVSLSPAGGWPEWVFTVPYASSAHPLTSDTAPMEQGSNCQRYAYAVEALFDVSIPPHRSSELWADDALEHVPQDQIHDLDLVLFNRTHTAWGSHVAIAVGDGLLHLCAEVGSPAFWHWSDFSQRQRYQTIVGAVRVAQPNHSSAR